MELLLWGKKPKDEPTKRHPLVCHLLDVAAVAEVLWARCFNAGLQERLAQALGLSLDETSKWLVFFAGLHDIGKASPDFQRKSPEAKKFLEESGLAFPSPASGTRHGLVTARVLPDLLTDPSFRQGRFPREFSRYIAFTVGGHHGQFPTSREVGNIKERGVGRGEWTEVRRRIFFQTADLLDLNTAPLPEPVDSPPFFILLAGLTSIADWIGSSEEHFPFAGGDVNPAEYLASARKRAEAALELLGWTGWTPPAARLSFKELFPFIEQPRGLQVACSGLDLEDHAPGLLLVEAPMGEGKTEAAMERADAWGLSKGQQGCFFALPTQATSNQMFGRVKDFLSQRYDRQRVNIQLLHGRAAFSEVFKELKLKAISPDEPGRPSVAAETWFTPKKRGLLAPFGVGTIDQILLAALRTRHVFVRLFGLAAKTVIIDEVHAYDVYMSTLLERLLKWLQAVGASVVLLSATLPGEKRKSLIEAFTGKKAPETIEAPYPRITFTQGSAVHSRYIESAREQVFRVEHMGDDPPGLVESIKAALSKGGTAAIVCNTVARAQETYLAFDQAGFLSRDELCLFHARFPLGRRLGLEDDVLKRFGKERRYHPGRRSVLVATQVIEQSLDLDFDLMATDLAPIDLVLQRAGRVHRHERPRPPGLEAPMIRVRVPRSDETGLPDLKTFGRVYEPYILLRSFLALRRLDQIRVPDEVEELIEAVYGEEAVPELPAAIQKVLDEARRAMADNEVAYVLKARLKEMPEPYDPDRSMFEFFRECGGNLEEDDPATHQALRAQTRLGPPSVNAVCLYRAGGRTFLDPEGKKAVDLEAPLTPALARALIMQEVGITHQGVVHSLLDQEIPSSWKREALLRHHRPLVFEEGLARIGSHTIELNPELGLLIKKE